MTTYTETRSPNRPVKKGMLSGVSCPSSFLKELSSTKVVVSAIRSSGLTGRVRPGRRPHSLKLIASRI